MTQESRISAHSIRCKRIALMSPQQASLHVFYVEAYSGRIDFCCILSNAVNFALSLVIFQD